MKAILCAGALLALGQSLATDYERATRLRIESTSAFTVETTSMWMERDGEPVDSSRGGAGAKLTEKRSVVQIDEYLERAEGRPSHVRRTFESIDSEGATQFGDRTIDVVREAPLEEVTLDITVGEDGEVVVEAAEGGSPDAEFLEGHQPTLALDGLLPEGEVEEKGSWELDADAIQRALGADVEAVLFPRPEPADEGGEGGRGGGGGRGRGGFGRGGGGVPTNLFRTGEWKGEATLESLSEEHEGVTCAAIAIEIEGSGALPEPEMGGGGRGGFATGAAARAAGENEFEIQAKGRLLYSLADGRPIHFELEGKIAYERRVERESERGSFVMTSSHEGSFTHGVRITEAKSE